MFNNNHLIPFERSVPVKKRLTSLLLCLVLIAYLFTPHIHVAATDSVASGNVIVSGDYAAYCYEDAQCCYVIFLDTSTGSGSFAVVYNSTPNLMYEYIFTLASSSIDVASSSFWSNLIVDCFENISLDRTINLNTAVIPSTDSQIDATYAVTSDPYKDEFLDWLENKHGPARENSYVCSTTIGGINFLQYENMSYQVVKSNAHIVDETLSISSFIISFLEMAISPTIVGILGLLFPNLTVPARTKVDIYTLCAHWVKYITVKDGTIHHSYSEKNPYYDGFVVVNTCIVDEEPAFIGYEPSESYFENDSLQFDAAYRSYMNID